MPSISGMRMSSSTTSAGVRCSALHELASVGRLANDLQSQAGGAILQQIVDAAARGRFVVGDHHAQGLCVLVHEVSSDCGPINASRVR